MKCITELNEGFLDEMHHRTEMFWDAVMLINGFQF